MARTAEMRLIELMILKQDISAVIEYIGKKETFQFQKNFKEGSSEKKSDSAFDIDSNFYTSLRNASVNLGIPLDDSEFNIKELLSVMPSSIVAEKFSGHSIAENVAYLNRLIRDPAFLNKLVEGKPGDVADEIRAELASAPISCEVERVLFCRHALTLMYPEYCPEVNLFSQSLSNVLPWL